MPQRVMTISRPASLLRITEPDSRKNVRHRRQVADAAVDQAGERDDRGLVFGDQIEIVHGRVVNLFYSVNCFVVLS
jgi:hypothetical protein